MMCVVIALNCFSYICIQPKVHHFVVKYVLNEVDENSDNVVRLTRSLEFDQPADLEDLAEVSVKQMVEFGLLHQVRCCLL